MVSRERNLAARPEDVLTPPLPSHQPPQAKTWGRAPGSRRIPGQPPKTCSPVLELPLSRMFVEAALPGGLAKPGSRDCPKGQEVKLNKREQTEA